MCARYGLDINVMAMPKQAKTEKLDKTKSKGTGKTMTKEDSHTCT